MSEPILDLYDEDDNVDVGEEDVDAAGAEVELTSDGETSDDEKEKGSDDEEEIPQEDEETEKFLPTPIVQEGKIIIINPSKRRSSNMLTQGEATELISQRSVQISQTGQAFVDITDETTAIEIARKELKQKKCPLMIRRPVGITGNTKYFEDWNPNDMILPTNFL
jgi:DNA-directed RNA polymerase I, II, and III subunit RPABC2